MSPSQQPDIALIGLTPNELQACKSSLQSTMPSCRFMDGEELSQKSVGLNDATQRLLIVSRFSTSDSALSWIRKHSHECSLSFAAYAIIPNLDLSCASSLATAGFSGFSSEFETKAIETWALNLPPVKSASLEDSQGNDGIQLYQRLIESMPDVIVRMDREGNYLDVFASPYTDIPVDPEQVVGRSSSEVLPAPLHEECHRASEQAFETGQVSVNEMEMPVEGGTKWIECRSVAISDDELMVVVRDATDSVNRQVAFDHNERLLRLAQQFTDTGIWEWEGSTNKVRFSSKLAQIYGLGESVWEGTYDELLENYIHPGDHATMVETTRRSIESGTSQSLEYRIVRPDGQERVLISLLIYHIS